MRRLNKFLRLPSADRRLLLNSIWLVWAVRLGLWLLPFPTLRRLLAKLSKGTSSQMNPDLLSRVAWAVTVSSEYIPQATCLTQALATKILLGRRGQPAVLRIGVTREEGGEFLAHAWIESNGEVVIGGSGSLLKRYTAIPNAGKDII